MTIFIAHKKTVGLLGLVTLAALVPATSAARTGVAGSDQATCAANFSGGAMHLCGPATGRLSVFGGYTFKKGTCKRMDVGGEPTFVLELGALKPGSRTNGGLPYLKVQIDGPLSRPTGGHVIAWYRGKRWSGYGQSFRGNASGGTFVATRTASGGGPATGSFRCNA